MLLGSSKVDITPLEPLELAGFKHREGKTSEVYQRLYLKTFILKYREDSCFVLLAADLIWWDSALIHAIKQAMKSRFDLANNNICFHATHNHSSPQTSKRFSETLGKTSDHYLTYLVNQVLLGVEQALSEQEKVAVKIYKGATSLGVNRRKVRNGKIIMAPNIEGSVDNDLTVISFETESGVQNAIWVHYTCHPTSTDENVISGEFPGVCCEKLEEEFPNSTVAYLQGFCGDIRPALINSGEFFRGRLVDMVKIGEKLSQDVFQLLQTEGKRCKPRRFSVQQIDIPLCFSDEAVEENIPEDLRTEWPKLVQNINGEYRLIIQYIQLMDKVSFISGNAEFVHEYGQKIKRINENILPLGYSNGMIGYICTKQQMKEGGYEAEESLYYFGYPAKLSIDTQHTIETNMYKIIKGDN